MQGLNTEFVNEKYNPEVLFSEFFPSPPSAAIKLCCKVWYEVELMQLNYNLERLEFYPAINSLFDYSIIRFLPRASERIPREKETRQYYSISNGLISYASFLRAQIPRISHASNPHLMGHVR